MSKESYNIPIKLQSSRKTDQHFTCVGKSSKFVRKHQVLKNLKVRQMEPGKIRLKVSILESKCSYFLFKMWKILYLSRTFYVKSKLTSQNVSFYHIWGFWILRIWQILHFWRLKFTKQTKFRTPQMAKMHFLTASQISKIDFT